MEDFGVYLTVPPGALTTCSQITLTVTSTNTDPTLDGAKAILSPVISLTPRGLRLNKPAKLVIPHSAAGATQGSSGAKVPAWKYITWERETNEYYEPNNWVEGGPHQDEQTFHVNTREFCLELLSFRTIRVWGQSKPTVETPASKVVKVVVYGQPSITAGEIVRLHVLCTDTYEEKVNMMCACVYLYSSPDTFLRNCSVKNHRCLV